MQLSSLYLVDNYMHFRHLLKAQLVEAVAHNGYLVLSAVYEFLALLLTELCLSICLLYS